MTKQLPGHEPRIARAAQQDAWTEQDNDDEEEEEEEGVALPPPMAEVCHQSRLFGAHTAFFCIHHG